MAPHSDQTNSMSLAAGESSAKQAGRGSALTEESHRDAAPRPPFKKYGIYFKPASQLTTTFKVGTKALESVVVATRKRLPSDATSYS